MDKQMLLDDLAALGEVVENPHFATSPKMIAYAVQELHRLVEVMAMSEVGDVQNGE